MLENIEEKDRSLALTAELVSAYVLHNSVPMSELTSLIQRVHEVLSKTLHEGTDASDDNHGKPTLAQIRQSIRPDALISFIDGKGYKTLKRHLTSHGLDPDSYRERYGLPADYPMVAQGYAEQRSQIAIATGLGAVGARSNSRKAIAHR